MSWLHSGRWLLILAVLASLGVWDRFRLAHYRDLGRQDILVPQRKAALLAQQASDDKERLWRDQLTKANQDAAKLRTQLAADAATARSAAVGLRNTLRAVSNQLSEAPRATLVKYIDTSGELFADCSQQYTELAAKADGHAADQQALIAAWPK